MASDIIIRVGWDNTDADRGRREAEKKTKETASRLQVFTRSLGGGLDTALLGGLVGGGAAGAGVLLAQGVVSGFRSALETADLYASFQQQLKSATGSVEAADEELRRLQASARKPGVELKAAVAGSARLQHLRFSADEAREVIEQFGNTLALSGGGSEDLAEVVDALSDIAASGDIADEKIDRLTERSAVLARVMQDTFGASTAAGIRATGITAEEFVLKLAEGQKELERAAKSRKDIIKENISEMDALKKKAGESLVPVQLALVKAGTGLAVALGEVVEDVPKIAAGFVEAHRKINPIVIAAEKIKTYFDNLTIDPEEVRKGAEQLLADLKKNSAEAEEKYAGTEFTPESEKLDPVTERQRLAIQKAQNKLAESRLTDEQKLNRMRSELEATEKRIVDLQAEGPPSPETMKTLVSLEVQRLRQLEKLEPLEKAGQERAEAESKANLEKITAQQQAVKIAETELEIARARAEGQDDLADALDDQLTAMQQALALQRATGKSYEESLAYAEEEAKLRKAAEGRKQEEAKGNYDEELKVLELRAKGRDKAADAAERELKIKARAEQLKTSTGVDDEEAKKLARREIELRDKIENRDKAGRRKIQGYSRERVGDETDYANPFRNLDRRASERRSGRRVGATPVTARGEAAERREDVADRGRRDGETLAQRQLDVSERMLRVLEAAV